MMKRLLGLMIAVVLCLSLMCSSALAISAAYSSTQAVADKLDELEIVYTLVGVTDSGVEVLKVPYGDYTIFFLFDEDLDLTSIRIWNIITFDDADLSKVLRSVNALNIDYKFTKFCVDEDDNTVSCEMDIIHRDKDVADIVLEGLLHMLSILKHAEEALSVYDR